VSDVPAAALRVVDAGPDDAEAVLGVIRRAFAARPQLVPPSTALEESADSVRAVLGGAGGLLVLRRDQPVGALVFDDSHAGLLGLRRVSVDPAHQAHGVASAMVGVAEDVAEGRGLDGLWLQARVELPETVSFWQRRGYVVLARRGPMLQLGKALWLAAELPTPEATGHSAGDSPGSCKPVTSWCSAASSGPARPRSRGVWVPGWGCVAR
jgi:tRNA threonylcarbamoyladenosine biosynthesis protein TsaE